MNVTMIVINAAIVINVPTRARIYEDVPPVPATDDEEGSNPGAGSEGFLTTKNNDKAVSTYSSYTIIASVLIGAAAGIIVYRRLNRNN